MVSQRRPGAPASGLSGGCFAFVGALSTRTAFFWVLPCSPEWNGLIRSFWRGVGNYHGGVVDEVSGGFLLK